MVNDMAMAQLPDLDMHGGDVRLLQHLQALEVRLHDAQVRSDAGQLQGLLHEDFLEFGRSGGVHDRAATVDSLAAALPAQAPARLVSGGFALARLGPDSALLTYRSASVAEDGTAGRSEEHTSELQSHLNLVCRLLLEKKTKNNLHLPITPHPPMPSH